MLKIKFSVFLFLNQNRKNLKIWNMHQNVRKNGVVIVSNNAQSDTCSLPGKSPTFYITNQFCRVRNIERLLYSAKIK